MIDTTPLRELGMTNNEIEVYLSLLRSGGAGMNEIASRTGLHRQVCYDAVDRLVEKGFASFVVSGRKKLFSAARPERILEYVDEQKERIASIMPGLAALTALPKEETFVEVVKGRSALRVIYKDIFRVMKERRVPLFAMGIDEQKFLRADEIAIRQHIAKLRKNGLTERLLTKASATHFFEGPQSEYRLVPDTLFNPTPTHVYGDTVAIIVWGTPLYGIIIRNREIADSNRKYFMMLWKGAKRRS